MEEFSYQARFLAAARRKARETVALEVVAAYLQALRAKVSRDAIEEQTKLATDLYKESRQRQEAEQSYIVAKLALANTLQVHITSDFEVEDTAAYGSDVQVDREAEVNAALASRPDYGAAQARVRAHRKASTLLLLPVHAE